jgi:hypothetical protein
MLYGLLDLFFEPEDGTSAFLQNVSTFLPDCSTASRLLHSYRRDNLKSHILLCQSSRFSNVPSFT